MGFIFISIIITLFITIIVLLVTDEEESDAVKRLANLKNNANPNEYEYYKREDIEELIKDTDYKNLFLKKFLDKLILVGKLKAMMKLADVKTPVDVFIFWMILPVVLFLILSVLIISKFLMFISLALLSAVVPYFILKQKFNRRKAAFLANFPDALDLLASSLRAGHSLLTAFQMVVQEMPEPLSSIFKLVSDDIALGRDTKLALEKMIENMPGVIDLRFFVTAVLIQREIGGNLAEVLDGLNYTIRERFKLLGQIAVQTAQAKLSGLILALAPVGLLFIINILNPEYVNPLFKTFTGQLLLLVALVMGITGFLVIRKVTNIKV